MIVDPHIHTAVSSACSRMRPEELVEAALRIGLGAIAVTEHGRIEGAEVTREIGSARGLLVFRGVEVYTGDGDMLVYGVYEDIQPYGSALDLVRWVHDRGGVVVSAHPFRGRYGLSGMLDGTVSDEVLASVDAVETMNGGDDPTSREAAREAAHRFARPGVGGSDSHHVSDVGRCVTVLDRPVSTEEGFICELRAGRVRPAKLSDALGHGGRWW